MPLPLKPNANDFRLALTRHRRPEVYHWTPARRLPSLLQYGILCRRELEARGISYDPHGYGRVDKEQDFAGHVCVSFYPQKGMMRSETGALAVIVMSNEVVIADGAFYCPENTAKSQYEFDDLVGCTSVANLDSLFRGPTEWELCDWQAEVWIPGGIPVDQFQRVNFRTREERDQALAACSSIASCLPKPLSFAVESGHFPTR